MPCRTAIWFRLHFFFIEKERVGERGGYVVLCAGGLVGLTAGQNIGVQDIVGYMHENIVLLPTTWFSCVYPVLQQNSCMILWKDEFPFTRPCKNLVEENCAGFRGSRSFVGLRQRTAKHLTERRVHWSIWCSWLFRLFCNCAFPITRKYWLTQTDLQKCKRLTMGSPLRFYSAIPQHIRKLQRWLCWWMHRLVQPYQTAFWGTSNALSIKWPIVYPLGALVSQSPVS